MRTPLIVGNWKMHTSLADAHLLATGVLNGAEHLEDIEIVLCPPFVWLSEVAHIINPHLLHLKLGAQNLYPEDEGAVTGEISAPMLTPLVKYVIVGHSERTHLFQEESDFVARKVQAALRHGLTPILCIGEDKQGADSKRQLVHRLEHLMALVEPRHLAEVVVAYEPVWAIGNDTPASGSYAEEIIAALRAQLTPQNRILYGGSVDGENAHEFLTQPEIDGLLVGGSSLKLKPFLTICRVANDLQIAKRS